MEAVSHLILKRYFFLLDHQDGLLTRIHDTLELIALRLLLQQGLDG